MATTVYSRRMARLEKMLIAMIEAADRINEPNGKATLAVITLSARYPGSTLPRAIQVRSSSPAPLNTRAATAISPATSPLRRALPLRVIRTETARAWARDAPVDCHAEARPTHTPTVSVIAAQNPISLASSAGAAALGRRPGGTAIGAARRIATATARPQVPPIAASVTLSVTSWAMMRRRAAPSADRTASSCVRTLARASSRFAMFAQPSTAGTRRRRRAPPRSTAPRAR